MRFRSRSRLGGHEDSFSKSLTVVSGYTKTPPSPLTLSCSPLSSLFFLSPAATRYKQLCAHVPTAPKMSDWKKYDSYDVPIDPKQQDKATTLKLYSFRRPHMRAFHFAWFGFFMAFVSWFAFAPLMKEIKADLGMTKNEVYNANISSVSSTILSRFVVGPLCDTFGARITSSTLLLMGCIPTFFAGLVNSATDVAIIRFFIGVMGATFVCTQYWTSQVFAKEFVGTANATSAGWGNLGGEARSQCLLSGAVQSKLSVPPVMTFPFRFTTPSYLLACRTYSQIFMVGIWNAFKTNYDSETAWRLSFLVPAAIVFFVAIGQVFLADDCPKGNYKELEAHGAMTRKSSAVSFKKGYSNVNSWIMFAQYAACFGVELTVNNTAANYFSDEFGLSTSKAGMVASLFGLMNLFARSVGGIWSDFLYRKFGAGVTGMRGRFFAQWTALVWEGCFLFLFTYMNTLGAAIPILILFSVGVQMSEGYLVRHRAVHRAGRDGRGVGHRGRRRQLRRGDVGSHLPVRGQEREGGVPNHRGVRGGPVMPFPSPQDPRVRHVLHRCPGRAGLHRGDLRLCSCQDWLTKR
ncbi:unnamed protein product [Ectocarpus sp. 6 AP-2014]